MHTLGWLATSVHLTGSLCAALVLGHAAVVVAQARRPAWNGAPLLWALTAATLLAGAAESLAILADGITRLEQASDDVARTLLAAGKGAALYAPIGTLLVASLQAVANGVVLGRASRVAPDDLRAAS